MYIPEAQHIDDISKCEMLRARCIFGPINSSLSLEHAIQLDNIVFPDVCHPTYDLK